LYTDGLLRDLNEGTQCANHFLCCHVNGILYTMVNTINVTVVRAFVCVVGCISWHK